MPRPQNRHAPTAVRWQFQQSTRAPFVSSIFPGLFRGGQELMSMERLRDHAVEPLTRELERPDGGVRDDARVPRLVVEQRDLAEMIARSKARDLLTVADHVDPARADRVEGVPGLSLRHDHLAGRWRDPLPVRDQAAERL